MKIHAQHQITKELSAHMHFNEQDLHGEIMHQITHAMAALMMQTADYKTTDDMDIITHEVGGHFFGMIEFRKIRNDIRDIIHDNSIAIRDKWAQIESLLGDTGCEKYQTSAQEREKRVSELLKNNKILNGINKSYKEASTEKEDKITRLEIALKAANEQIELMHMEANPKYKFMESHIAELEKRLLNENMVLQRLSTAATAPEHMKREILHFLYQSINQDILGQPTLNDESPALKNGTIEEHQRVEVVMLKSKRDELEKEVQELKEKNKEARRRIDELQLCNQLHQKTIVDLKQSDVTKEIKIIEKFLWKKFPWSWPKFRSK